ncbi:MAG: hypothetical protein K2M06_05325 [Muribaculaceae bacterium]|nr:hypothetical protein [Muribaculaceae bacterium]
MRKLRQLLIAVALISTLEGSAQMLLDYATGATTASSALPMPVRDIESLPNGNIRVTYNISTAFLSRAPMSRNVYTWVVGGFGFSMSEGKEAIPCRIDCFYVPEGKTVKITIDSLETTSFQYSIMSSSKPAEENSNGNNSLNELTSPQILETNVSNSNSFSFDYWARLKNIQTYRGVNFANVKVKSIFPSISINGRPNIVALKKLSYLVEFIEDENTQSANKSKKDKDLRLAVDDRMILMGIEKEPLKDGQLVGGSGGGNSNSPVFPIDYSFDLSNQIYSVDKTYVIITTDNLKASDNIVDSKHFTK